MREISILFITNKMDHYVEKSTTYVISELEKQSRLILWHDHGDIQSILNNIRTKPDFILLNDFHPTYGRYITGLNKIKIPIGMIMHDLHYKKGARTRLMREIRPTLIFTHYRDAFLTLYPEFQDQMIWFPHHVPEQIFFDYQLEKEIDVLMIGSMIPRLYPLRNHIYEKMKQRKGFIYHAHPGYGKESDRGITGEGYAREMNRSKIFVTCDSIYHYPLLKYMESLACHTLLLAPATKELEDLGFIDQETFVAIDETNFSERVTKYLSSETERNNIASRGYEMVRKKHLTSIRVAEMIQHIQKVI
ncbi:glycosyltransferase [Guptibacillus hwajinpoensis]|uniref:glycosyltransferase n=1 Tax=Guptibacillus hwajinpoensis TaxID=208199 RepID=UPI001CFE324F|nr:glycosyltransferase [Pseudalkalibacillus hwajinpoensis]WLR59545.1 glycosyltransferase [Pseudalkalibacillus hwajinpoensis]